MTPEQIEMDNIDTMPQQSPVAVREALSQAVRLGADGVRWDVSYDRKQDVLSWRRPDRGPSVAYYVPARPEVVLFVELEGERLVGIDMQCFRRVIAAENAMLSDAFKSWLLVSRLARIPGVRRLARLAVGKAQNDLREQLRRAAEDEFRPPDDPRSPTLRFQHT